jgi:hypothetical protein
MVLHGEQQHDHRTICTAISGDRIVPFKVTECTSYRNKNQLALHDMKSIAWIISTDKNKGQIGFAIYKPSDLSRQQQQQIFDEIESKNPLK